MTRQEIRTRRESGRLNQEANMAATYMGEKAIAASVGDIVMAPGNVRAIVIAVNEASVKVLGIGTDINTGDTFVLPPPYIHDYPASQCHYMEKQILNM